MPDSIFGQGKYLTAEERDAYEREHGMPPVGYRATGPVEWFKPWHPETAPCWKCGQVTDQFIIGHVVIEPREWGGATYYGHVLCGETAYAFCEICERLAAIATLRKRQDLGIGSEVVYLAELEAMDCGGEI